MSASMPTLDFDMDRRGSERHPCLLKVFCKPFQERCTSEPWPAEVRDLSRTGACFLLERRFEKGTLLVVELRHADIAVTLPARIVRIGPSGKYWELGCAFATHLDGEEVDALVSSPTPGLPERRAA